MNGKLRSAKLIFRKTVNGGSFRIFAVLNLAYNFS